MQINTASLMEYFREGISRARQRASLQLTETTEFYVVNLLAEFLSSGKLYGENGELKDAALALMVGKALQTENTIEQYRLFREIGDRSLYVSGFFPDSLKRKVVDIDYYISIGGGAYASVSALARGELFSEVFEELSEKFAGVVDVISDVSESSGITSDRDILRLYERWLMTRSTRLSEKLQQEGILPTECKSELPH